MWAITAPGLEQGGTLMRPSTPSLDQPIRPLLAGLMLAVIAAAGCDSAVPTPSLNTSPTATSTTLAAAPPTTLSAVPMPSELAFTHGRSSAPSSSGSAAPTPDASSGTLPVVGLAPSGPWTSIKWIDAGATFPQVPPATGDTASLRIFGWSRGYVGFVAGGARSSGSSAPPSVVATSSADGLRWSPPRSIDTIGLDDRITIVGVVEGPAGLVAVGEYASGTCGGPPSVAAAWRSTDGRSWHLVQLPKNMTAFRVRSIEAGSAGYIGWGGTASDGVTPVIWLSADGASWTSRQLRGAVFGKLIVDGATSFAGGFVISGATLGPDGCGGATSLSPSLWWSPDGVAWTRNTLPGSTAAPDASTTIQRISDRALLATETASKGSVELRWVSTDGRHWTRAATPTNVDLLQILTDGRRGVVVNDPADASGPPTIAVVSDGLAVRVLAQTGPGPVASPDSPGWTAAVGPTGVLVVSLDVRTLWLGVPSGG